MATAALAWIHGGGLCRSKACVDTRTDVCRSCLSNALVLVTFTNRCWSDAELNKFVFTVKNSDTRWSCHVLSVLASGCASYVFSLTFTDCSPQVCSYNNNPTSLWVSKQTILQQTGELLVSVKTVKATPTNALTVINRSQGCYCPGCKSKLKIFMELHVRTLPINY